MPHVHIPATPIEGPVFSGFHDTQTGVPLGMPRGARCVQRFDDSLNSAIHITYRISLRSSSMREPRDPLLKVILIACNRKNKRHSIPHLVLCEKRKPPYKEDPRGNAQRVRWMCVRESSSVHDL